MFESLDSLLIKENMNIFLKETFKGIPEDYCFSLMAAVLSQGVQNGVSGKTLYKKIIANDVSGKLPAELTEKINSCVKTLYTFSYILGQDVKDKAKPDFDGTMKTDNFEYAYNYLTGILENILNYFKPEMIDNFREKTKEHFKNILQDALMSGEYVSEKRTIH